MARRGKAGLTARKLVTVSLLAASALGTTTQAGLAFEQGASFTILPGSTMGIPFANTHSPGFYFYSLGNYGTDVLAA